MKNLVFVPTIYQDAILSLSKNALADMMWNLAAQASRSADDPEAIWEVVREEANVTVKDYRKDRLHKAFNHD